MTNVAGKTTLQVGVDGTQAEAGIDSVKQAVRELNTEVGKTAKTSSDSFKVIGGTADDAGNRINRSGQRVLKSLENQANRATLTAAEYARLRAEQAGVASAAAPYIARIEAASRGTAQLGMSAKATAAAMRGVPAQLTDIAVGLQGGQAPLTVLLQQGGQLKDMFGGVVPAAKALGTTLLGLVNPYTLAAAGAAALGYAVYSGAQETKEFSKTLVMSGNVSGRTADQLSELATQVGRVAGSRGAAVEALNLIAASSLGAGSNISRIAAAAVDMNRTVGREVGDTVKEFEELGKSPTEALYKLNQQHNFLTAAVYAQVAALEQQGRKQEAARMAQDAYATAVEQQTARVRGNLGTLERAWDTITRKAGEAWQAMKGVGQAPTFDEVNARLSAVNARITQLRSSEGFSSTGGGAAVGDGGRAARAQANKDQKELNGLIAEAQMLQLQRDNAAVAGQAQRTENARTDAIRRQQILDREVESNADRRKREIKQIRDDAELTKASAEDTAKRIAAVNAKYKDPKGSGNTVRDSAATTLLLRLKEQEASLRVQVDAEGKLTDASKERAKFEQLIAELKDKKVLTADQKSLLANQDSIRAQLDKNVAVSAELKSKEALGKLEERSLQIQQSILSSQSNRQEQYDRSLATMGLGRQAQERVGSEATIRREYQRYQDQLNKAGQNGALGGSSFIAEQAKIAQALDLALQTQREYYAEVDRIQGDWRLGFKSAYADYVDQSKNAFAQAGNFFQSVTGSMESSLTRFFTTGKFGIRDFANIFIQESLRMSVQATAAKGLGFLGTALSGLLSGAAATTAPTSGIGLQASGNVGSITPGSGLGLNSGGFSFGGYRASGGDIRPGRFYEVNEQAPELYKQGGRTWLMSGEKTGYVEPLTKSAGAGTGAGAMRVSIETNVYTDGRSESTTTGGENALGQRLSEGIRGLVQQEMAKSSRQGGMGWNARNGGR